MSSANPGRYKISITDMEDFAARGGDYYGYDIRAGETITEEYIGLSREEAVEEFLESFGSELTRDNLTIERV